MIYKIKNFVLKHATRMSKSWNPSYLFVATQEGFFFDEITNIVDNKGGIQIFSYGQISEDIQEKYLKILKDFEANN